MSEEDMFENPYELLDKGFDKYDFAQIIILLQADRREWIEQYTKSHNDYVELEQENQQLKENNQSYQEEMCRTWNIADKYKSVLDEIREYIEHEWFKRGQLGIIDKSFQEWQLKDILQILDKVKND